MEGRPPPASGQGCEDRAQGGPGVTLCLPLPEPSAVHIWCPQEGGSPPQGSPQGSAAGDPKKVALSRSTLFAGGSQKKQGKGGSWQPPVAPA